MVTKKANGNSGDEIPRGSKKRPHFLPKKGTFYTKKEVAKAFIENNGLKYITAKALCISPQTMLRYLHRWPSLRKHTKRGREYMKDVAEQTLLDAMQIDRNINAARYVLDRLGGDRGFEKTSVNKVVHTQNEVPKVEVKLTEEARQKMFEEMRNRHTLNINVNLPEGSTAEVVASPVPLLEGPKQPILLEGNSSPLPSSSPEGVESNGALDEKGSGSGGGA